MKVGICRITFFLHGVTSLKEKRSIVKKIIERTKNCFNMSVSETDFNDLWQKSEVGIAMIGNDSSYINSKLDKAVEFIESMGIAEINDIDIEVISL